MKVYHRWLSIIFHYSPVFPRSMRVLSLFFGIVMMLFIQSLVYNISDPDDGSCEECENEICCGSYKSTLNPKADRCSWSWSNSTTTHFSQPQALDENGSCSFRPISQDMIRQIIVATVLFQQLLEPQFP